MAKGFDLGAMLKGVSELDTKEERIQKIRLDLIDDDPENFYQLSGIEALADNIATCGLMDPIRVRVHPEDSGRYMIVSGHRRRSAVALLAREDPARWSEISCIVQTDDVSPELQQLRLIYANSNTRTMTNSELGEQAEQVEKLLYELKQQGYDFPGRMRDHVAEACKMSQSKLARLKVITDKLDPIWRKAWKKGKLPESKAYALSQMPQADQHLLGMHYAECPQDIGENAIREKRQVFAHLEGRSCERRNGTPCINVESMREKAVKSTAWYYEECKGCCFECERLAKCQYACPMAAEKKKQLRADAREEKQQEAEKQELRDRPKIQTIQAIYKRIGQLRKRKKIDTRQLFEAGGRWFGTSDEQKYMDLEMGNAKVTAETDLPFGYHFKESDVRHLCAVADLLDCSIDYLLGRNVSESDTWQTGTPAEAGEYVVLCKYSPDAPEAVECVTWDGNSWDSQFILEDTMILRWIKKPKGEKKRK